MAPRVCMQWLKHARESFDHLAPNGIASMCTISVCAQQHTHTHTFCWFHSILCLAWLAATCTISACIILCSSGFLCAFVAWCWFIVFLSFLVSGRKLVFFVVSIEHTVYSWLSWVTHLDSSGPMANINYALAGRLTRLCVLCLTCAPWLHIFLNCSVCRLLALLVYLLFLYIFLSLFVFSFFSSSFCSFLICSCLCLTWRLIVSVTWRGTHSVSTLVVWWLPPLIQYAILYCVV